MAVTDTTVLNPPNFTKRLAAGALHSTKDLNVLVGEIARRRLQIVGPLFAASFVFYLVSLVALAYFPSFVTYKLYGSVNLAYALAIAQFVMTFLVAFIYTQRTDHLVDPVVKRAFDVCGQLASAGGAR